ncbi:hypothetical protein ACHAXH_006028 [Discostella pseudostelligera]
MMLPLSSSFIVRILVIAAVAIGTGKRNGVDVVVAGFNLSSPPPKSTMMSYQRTTMMPKSATRTTTTAIHVGASSSFNTNDHDDDDDDNNNNGYNFQQLLLDNASACALSDTCSIEYAELYLREIFRAQVGCAAQDYLEDGYVATTTNTADEVCNLDNLHAIGEIVAKLKDKIRHHGSSQLDGKHEDVVNSFWDQRQVELETLAATLSPSSSASPAAAWVAAPLKPAYLAIAALYTIAIMHAFHYPPPALESAMAVPFTFQEVWYAIRDGYFDTLVSHWFRNGGLLVGSVDFVDDAMLPLSSSLSSLTPQEVFWSIRDGYADDTLFSSSTLSSSSFLSSMGGMVPFSPQEVWWAMQGGYVDDLMGHWIRNGGL